MYRNRFDRSLGFVLALALLAVGATTRHGLHGSQEVEIAGSTIDVSVRSLPEPGQGAAMLARAEVASKQASKDPVSTSSVGKQPTDGPIAVLLTAGRLPVRFHFKRPPPRSTGSDNGISH